MALKHPTTMRFANGGGRQPVAPVKAARQAAMWTARKKNREATAVESPPGEPRLRQPLK